MNRTIRNGALAAALVFCAGPAAGHGEGGHAGEALADSTAPRAGAPIHVPKATQFLMDIQSQRVEAETLPRRRTVLGRIQTPPARRADVHAPFTGLVLAGEDANFVQPGDRVEKGQALAQIEQVVGSTEQVSLASDIATTRTQLRLAREDVEHAETEYERVQNLGDAASERRLVQARAALRQARVRVEGLKKQLDEMESGRDASRRDPRLDTLRAPIGGIVASVNLTPGAFVRPETRLIEIVNNGVVWAAASVYEEDLPLLDNAGSATVHTGAYDATFNAGLHHVAPRLDSESRTIEAIFEVENPNGQLREGMLADIAIESADTVTGPMVPMQSVVEQNGLHYVYIKTGPETFVRRNVQPVGRWDDRFMLETGVTAGEIVVVQGVYQVRASTAITQSTTTQEEEGHGHPH